MIKLKLPGVLKSKKRNHPFWIPGTIWNVIIQGNPKEYMVPKEMSLLFSPLSFNVNYKELKTFTDVFHLTNFLWTGESHDEIYNLLHDYIYAWPHHRMIDGDSLVDLFYLHFLRLLGYFSVEDACSVCQKNDTLSSHYYYRFNQGKLCEDCFQGATQTAVIKIRFDSTTLSKKVTEISPQKLQESKEDSVVLRESILNYLKTL